jgi:hypothetical protein
MGGLGGRPATDAHRAAHTLDLLATSRSCFIKISTKYSAALGVDMA